jgi:hypothetical protein
LGIISKKPLPNLSSQTFTPKFSSKNFIVLVIQITIYFNFFSKKKKKEENVESGKGRSTGWQY